MRRVAIWCATAFMLSASGAHAFIRDAEIESTLRYFATPIFVEAGLPPENIRIFVVNNPSINAFVAGGLNMFFHTGLIKAAETPGMLIGVIAHETGHIAGAHITQLSATASRASIGGVIGAIIGAATMAAGGGQAGAGIIAGSQNIAIRSLYSGIRVKEQSADHAALSYLDALGYSASGMMDMFELLRKNERGTQRDPYLQTHPLSRERVATVRNHTKQSDIPANSLPKEHTLLHARMRAKLIAFTEPYQDTMRAYPPTDTSVAARYARAIAAFRSNRFQQARTDMEALLEASPNDPFFHDTLGQILFESAQVEGAIQAYGRAHALLEDSALIATDLAKALIARGGDSDIKRAITLLEHANQLDGSYSLTWHQLAIAYGRDGQLGKSYAAIANRHALLGQYEDALQQITRAKPLLTEDPVSLLAIEDLERDVKQEIHKRDEADSIF
jgi:predicted Zn-dependent protease